MTITQNLHHAFFEAIVIIIIIVIIINNIISHTIILELRNFHILYANDDKKEEYTRAEQ